MSRIRSFVRLFVLHFLPLQRVSNGRVMETKPRGFFIKWLKKEMTKGRKKGRKEKKGKGERRGEKERENPGT